MKKMGVAFVILVSIMSLHIAFESQAKDSIPLLELAMAIDDVGAEVDGWSLQAKEQEGFTSHFEGYKSYVNILYKQTKEFNWEKPTYEKDTITQRATKQLNWGKETVTILTHRIGPEYDTIISYELTGEFWNEKIKNDVIPHFSTRTSELFLENPSFFTCITGKISDTMDIALNKKAKSLMRHFNANYVEGIEEESFVSLSAYTKHWNTSITTNQKEMNLQIALRNQAKNKSTRVMIGTPILTAEY